MRKGKFKSFLAYVRGQIAFNDGECFDNNPYQEHGDDKNKSDHKDWLAGYEAMALEEEQAFPKMVQSEQEHERVIH